MASGRLHGDARGAGAREEPGTLPKLQDGRRGSGSRACAELEADKVHEWSGANA